VAFSVAPAMFQSAAARLHVAGTVCLVTASSGTGQSCPRAALLKFEAGLPLGSREALSRPAGAVGPCLPVLCPCLQDSHREVRQVTCAVLAEAHWPTP
jgi:hypothetical protein